MEIVAYLVTCESPRSVIVNPYTIKIHKTPTGFSGRTIKFSDLIFENPVGSRHGSSFEIDGGYMLIVDDVGDIHVVTHDEYASMKEFCVDVDNGGDIITLSGSNCSCRNVAFS